MSIAISGALFSQSYDQKSDLTAQNLACSQSIQTLFTKATDSFDILSFTGAAWLGRFSKLSSLKIVSRFSDSLSFRQTVAFISGVVAEAFFFQGDSFLKQQQFSLPEFEKGVLHTSFILTGCKIAGGIASSNFIFTQIFQSALIVGINTVFEGSLVEQEKVSFTEKMILAVATSLPLYFSSQLLAICSPVSLLEETNQPFQPRFSSVSRVCVTDHFFSSLFHSEIVTAEGGRWNRFGLVRGKEKRPEKMSYFVFMDGNGRLPISQQEDLHTYKTFEKARRIGSEFQSLEFQYWAEYERERTLYISYGMKSDEMVLAHRRFIDEMRAKLVINSQEFVDHLFDQYDLSTLYSFIEEATNDPKTYIEKPSIENSIFTAPVLIGVGEKIKIEYGEIGFLGYIQLLEKNNLSLEEMKKRSQVINKYK